MRQTPSVARLGAALVALTLLSACSGSTGDDGPGGNGKDAGAETFIPGGYDVVFPDARADAADVKLPPADAGGRDGFDAGGSGGADAADAFDPRCEPPADFLCPCTENEDCASSWCILTLAGRVCTETCINECPEGWLCQQNLNALPDVIYICVQPMSLVCRPCLRDADCRSGFGETDDRCLDYGPDGRFCGTECGPQAACPAGYDCTETEIGAETLSLCTPTDGTCDCSPAFVGDETSCYVENAIGRCTGTRACAEDGLEPCSAPTPAAEDCDGVDNDCDGTTDEVAELGTERCGLGECDHTITSCLDGGWQECDPFEGSTDETCNDLDDDCDGQTDETWEAKGAPCDGPDPGSCATGRWVCREDGTGLGCEDDDDAAVELCNGFDDDCDGETDEVVDLGTTTCGLGACRHTIDNCQGGAPRMCDPLEGSAPETCDGFDDDCDGATDELVDLGRTTCGLGECVHTIDNCADGVPQTCDPLEGSRTERCDDRDDDCDGGTDEDWPTKYAACDAADADRCERGQLVCNDPQTGLICEGDEPETLEDCNAVDDDCDGETDEAADLGATTCGLGVCAHMASDCVDGEWLDCDPFEGAQPDDDPDPLLLDTNCDGVDGDAARSVFVDAFNGNDGRDGTREAPVRTLPRALQLADPATRPHVLVSVGSYTGPITLVGGVSLFGGYNAAEGWRRDPSNTVTISGPDRAVVGFDISATTTLDTLDIVAQGNAAVGGSVYALFLVRSSGVRIVNCHIAAGDAGSGAGGANGSTGPNGDSGDTGGSGCEYGSCLGICGDCSRPEGGGGGVRVCAGVDVSGGQGGGGGSQDSNGIAGQPGSGPQASPDCTSVNRVSCPGPGGSSEGDGTPGQPGGPGGRGGDGGAGLSFGELTEGGYGASAGGNGTPGQPGSGGGGGGGGGGDEECFIGIFGCKTYGSAGGGGGSGGCGGTAGFGGGGGGGSFGVFLWSSSIVFDGGSVETARGGLGGAGGSGGTGGPGGLHGNGGAKGDEDSQGLGAVGGDGGGGGDGGHGGGGGGGPSVGILCGGGAAPVLTDVTIQPGFGGPGGTSAGNAGATGVSEQTRGCP